MKLQSNSIIFQVYILDYVMFWGAEILGPEGHPCIEVTQVSFEGKMAVVVYLVAVRSLSLWHNFTLTLLQIC